MTRGRLVAGAVLAVLVAFYAWTALTSADPHLHRHRTDPYNLQTSAFLHGQLHLRVAPPRALVRLRNPYDPHQSLPVLPREIRDLTLYHGRLYTYWGPVPALLAFAPFRALGLGDLPPALALLAFALGALGFQFALLRFLARRYAPEAPLWAVLVAFSAVALGNVMAFMLRTPEVYEVAIGAGACFASAALYLFATGTLGERGVVLSRIAVGSGAAGLAFASRPPTGIVIAFALPAIVIAWRAARGGGRQRISLVVAALWPFAAFVAAIAVYNAARFGSPAEFGLRYTLTGFDIHDGKLGHLSFLPPGLWYYLVQPLRPRVEFPFVWLGPPPFYPGSVPSLYEAPEKVGGIVWSVPFVLVLAAAPLLLRRRARSLWLGVALAGACGLLLMAFSAYYQPVATQRYEADFLTFLAPAAALVWLVVLASARRGRSGLVAGFAVLAAWTAAVGVTTSLVGYDDSLRRHHSGTWATLRGPFAPIPEAAAAIAGRPMIAAVDHDPVDPRPWHVLSLDLDGAGFGVAGRGARVQVIAAHRMRAVLRALVTADPARGAGPGVAVSANGRRATARRLGAVALPVTLHKGRNDVVVRPLRHSADLGRRVLTVSGLRIR